MVNTGEKYYYKVFIVWNYIYLFKKACYFPYLGSTHIGNFLEIITKIKTDQFINIEINFKLHLQVDPCYYHNFISNFFYYRKINKKFTENP